MKKHNLYNKYRPTNFKTLVGQEIVKTVLTNVLKTKKLVQSFIFFGPPGTGKTSLSRIFAKSWNCLKFEDDICNQCENCRLIDQKKTVDVLEIDAASNNGVEFIRELVSNTQYLPLDLKKKVYIIDEAHNLTSQSWNALLKVIEEPSDHIIFLFLTTQIKKIIPTILSRCQKLHFSYLSNELLLKLISDIEIKEDKEIEPLVREKLVQLCQGSARELLSLLEQLFLSSEKHINMSHYEKTFSFLGLDSVIQFLLLIFQKKSEESLKFLKENYFSGTSLVNLFQDIFQILMDLEIYKKTQDASLLSAISEKDASLFDEYQDYFFAFLNYLNPEVPKFTSRANHYLLSKVLLLNLLHLVGAPTQSETLSSDKKIKKSEKKPLPPVDEPAHVDVCPPTKEEIKEDKISESKETKSTTEALEAWEMDKEFEEKKMFSLETIKIFPESLNDYFTKTEGLEYRKEILYSIKYSDRNKSLSAFESISKYLDKSNSDPVVVSVLSRFIKKYQVIASDVSALLVFEKEDESDKFNAECQKESVQQELTKICGLDYFWFAIPKFQLAKYVNKAKALDKSKLKKNLIFKIKKNELFADLSSLLKD